jgi:negative regulator of genetic competence, sporulation and motility
MLVKLNKTAILLCLLAISCDARRRSRIDVPVTKSADATDEDKTTAATVMTEKIEAEKLEAPTTMMSDISDEEKVSESNSSEESPSYEDCELDNISFEMITG